MNQDIRTPLISPDELRRRLSEQHEHVIVLDCSWHLPTVDRDAGAEFKQERIPGAQFFDIDTISDSTSELPHMLPTGAVFSESVAQLGVESRSEVVVYDSVGLFSAARVWWMFRVFGHANVRVLDGGLPGWKAMGGELVSGVESSRNSNQTATQKDTSAALLNKSVTTDFNADMVCGYDQLLTDVGTHFLTVLDARSKARFDGSAPEPRAELRSGHIPGSASLPFTDLLNTDSNSVMRLKPKQELRNIFESYGVTDESSVVTTCGSGVTAAIITLALHIAGYEMGRLYDGSWTDWGSRSGAPVATA